MPTLTIAIPTYDRVGKLLENLPALLTQLTDECDLIILDNQSPIPISDAIAGLLEQFPTANVKIIRHRSNLGANANILRCMEICESRWLWVLGDDDRACPGAIAAIIRTVEVHGDKCFINFASDLAPRKAAIVAKGLREFVQKMDSFGNCLLISTGLYQATFLQAFLGFGYQYGVYANGPLFAMLELALSRGSSCLFSEEQIISYNPEPGAAVPYALRIMSLLEAQMDSGIRKELAMKIDDWPPQESIVGELMALAGSDKTAASALYYYDQIRTRFGYYDTCVIRRLKWSLGRFFIAHFRLAACLLRFRRRISRRSDSNFKPRTDFYTRF